MTRFSIVVHGHQPPGNFDSVFQRGVAQCYLPFFELLEQFPAVRMTVHFSGSLLEWLDRHDPRVIEALQRLVARGQVEPAAAGLFEPVLALLPPGDRVNQLLAHRAMLQRLFGVDTQTGWLTERIWMQEIAASLHDGGIGVVPLDDLHFLSAGLALEELTGPFRTEYQGKAVAVVPAIEELRMSIPWRPVPEVLATLRREAARGVPLLTFADDIEKFGMWPGTFDAVYRRGWLRDFFEGLTALSEVETAPLGEAVAVLPPGPRVYLPDGSYPEMLRWSLPPEGQRRARASQAHLETNGLWEEVRPQLRSGTYFQFLAKYPESNHIHKRMLDVSARVARRHPPRSVRPDAELPPAVFHLYRAQANCAYWHGLFGGTYLALLRQALFRSLLRAERALEAEGAAVSPLRVFDLDADGVEEALLSTQSLTACVAPGDGGSIVELSDRAAAVNIVDTLARRPEAYHEEGDRAPYPYDRGRRGCFLDRFLPPGPPPARSLPVIDQGDFTGRTYDMRTRRRDGRPEVSLSRTAAAPGGIVRIEKVLAFEADGRTLHARYRLTGLEGAVDARFAVEHNLGLFFDEYPRGEVRLGERTHTLQRGGAARRVAEAAAGLAGHGISVRMTVSRDADIDVRPIATVSQSEAGFEEIPQSLACLFSWPLRLGPGETFELDAALTLSADPEPDGV
ncbi:MAG: alpha-amylase/4-alpha-glucanotransferase domain-containing protein [Dehalococcoidia bacterium]